MTEPNRAHRGSPAVIVSAVDQLAAVLAPNWDMLDATWRTLTCQEAELTAAVFRTAGYAGLAESIIGGHAENDEPGDEHYSGPGR